MKATLTFTLPEEQHEYMNAVNGAKMHSILWEFDQWLRAKLKYGDLDEGQYKAYEASRTELRILLAEENIDLDN